MRKREKRPLAKKVLKCLEDGDGAHWRSCPDEILLRRIAANSIKTRDEFCHKLFPTLEKLKAIDCGECPCEELSEKYVRAKLRRYIRGEFEIDFLCVLVYRFEDVKLIH